MFISKDLKQKKRKIFVLVKDKRNKCSNKPIKGFSKNEFKKN